MKVMKANCGASVPASKGKKVKMAMGGMAEKKKPVVYYAEGGMVGKTKKAKMAMGGMTSKKTEKMNEKAADKKGMMKTGKKGY